MAVGEGAAIVAALGCENVRLMFDYYHVGMVGGDVLGELAAALPIVGHVQVASVPDRAEPDAGRLDYREVFAALPRLGYTGWIGAEYKPRGDTNAGLRWVGAVGAEI